MSSRDDYRPEFTEALRLLAEAFALAKSNGADLPVIVGGAAVEYHTASEVQSADIDLVTSDNEIMVVALETCGFRRTVAGSLRNLVHPELLIGVDFVSGMLFEGRTDRSRLELVQLDEAGSRSVQFPPVEDMIADRLGQFESVPDGVPEMLEQAKLLFQLADDLDHDYLRRRVSEECSSLELLSLLGPRP